MLSCFLQNLFLNILEQNEEVKQYISVDKAKRILNENNQQGNFNLMMDDLNNKINDINLNNGNVGEQINTAINSAMSNINLEELSDNMQNQLISNIKKYATTKVENNYINTIDFYYI